MLLGLAKDRAPSQRRRRLLSAAPPFFRFFQYRGIYTPRHFQIHLYNGTRPLRGYCDSYITDGQTSLDTNDGYRNVGYRFVDPTFRLCFAT